MAYKLVKYESRPVLKLSTGKRTLVDEKQVFRRKEEGDRLVKDIITLRDEKADGEPLLRSVMKNGKRQQRPEPLDAIRERFQTEFRCLDGSYKALQNPEPFPVELGPHLQELQRQVIHEVSEKELGES
jgi:nicotinate phosphoribosyltransferase